MILLNAYLNLLYNFKYFGGIMRFWLFLFLCIAVNAFAMGSRKKSEFSSFEKYFYEQRIQEIKRQAPLIGIPVDRALAIKPKVIFCQETGRNSDGSYVCGGESPCSQLPKNVCAHGWFSGAQNSKDAIYMFAIPHLNPRTIAHEVHHELVIIHYGITGHPRKSRITRIDNGQPMVINHAAVIGWRWPVLINFFLPESMEIGPPWGWDEFVTKEEKSK